MRYIINAVLVCISFYGCVSKNVIYNSAPTLIPGTRSEMNTAGFWIGNHPDPDRVIAPSQEIDGLNNLIREQTGTVKDLMEYPRTYQGEWLDNTFKNMLKYVNKRRYFTAAGHMADNGFFDPIEDNMGCDQIPDVIDVRFGFIVAYSHQRLLPTEESLYTRSMNIEFDRLQNSALDIGTPLTILHETSDGKWLYAVSPLSEGWLLSGNVAVCTRDQFVHYLTLPDFVVTTSAKADIYLDSALKTYYGFARMGGRFPHDGGDVNGAVEILLPMRMADGRCTFAGAYVSEAEVNRGYLPYTPRNIIVQSFRLINAPYGWGGMSGEQDCSRFIEEVFSTVGIYLPRNSRKQAMSGRLVGPTNPDSKEEKMLDLLINETPAGTSILQINGHIMLFLGVIDGSPYAIHDMWAYAVPGHEAEELKVVNRVVVTNLYLGKGTDAGTFLERLLAIRSLDKLDR